MASLFTRISNFRTRILVFSLIIGSSEWMFNEKSLPGPKQPNVATILSVHCFIWETSRKFVQAGFYDFTRVLTKPIIHFSNGPLNWSSTNSLIAPKWTDWIGLQKTCMEDVLGGCCPLHTRISLNLHCRFTRGGASCWIFGVSGIFEIDRGKVSNTKHWFEQEARQSMSRPCVSK